MTWECPSPTHTSWRETNSFSGSRVSFARLKLYEPLRRRNSTYGVAAVDSALLDVPPDEDDSELLVDGGDAGDSDRECECSEREYERSEPECDDSDREYERSGLDSDESEREWLRSDREPDQSDRE